MILVAVTNFQGIAFKQLVQLFLAAAIIVPAARYYCAYLVIARNQIFKQVLLYV
jgi:hypothetical protein